MSASVRSSKNRSTTTARCLRGSRPSATQRSWRVSGPDPVTGHGSGRSPVGRSPRHLRRPQVASVLTRILRTYCSGWSSSRRHANHALLSPVCSRSSASAGSPVTRNAVRSSRSEHTTTNSSKSGRVSLRVLTGALRSMTGAPMPLLLPGRHTTIYHLAARFGCPRPGSVAMVTLTAFADRAVGTALPSIVRDLDALASFGLANAGPAASFLVTLAFAGAWADRRGPLPVLLVGLAPTIAVVVVGRLLSGVGEALVDVSLIVLVARALPSELRPRIFSLVSAAWV